MRREELSYETNRLVSALLDYEFQGRAPASWWPVIVGLALGGVAWWFSR